MIVRYVGVPQVEWFYDTEVHDIDGYVDMMNAPFFKQQGAVECSNLCCQTDG
jgi:hypothetical protein